MRTNLTDTPFHNYIAFFVDCQYRFPSFRGAGKMRILSNSKMEPKNTCTAKRFYSVCRRKKCMHICSILVGFPPFPHRVENGEKPEHMAFPTASTEFSTGRVNVLVCILICICTIERNPFRLSYEKPACLCASSTNRFVQAERIHKTFDERLENVRFSRKKSTEKEKKWRNMAENTGKSTLYNNFWSR